MDYTDSELTITEQNQYLAAGYLKMNDEGREVLDMVIGKITENHLGIEELQHREFDKSLCFKEEN